MSSGVGAWGGSGVCYPIWSDFCTCVFDKPLEVCEPYRRDYQECLHNNKEYKSYKSADYGKGANERLAKVREAMKQVEAYEHKVDNSN